MPAALVGTALPAVVALPPLAAAPAAGLTLLYPFLDEAGGAPLKFVLEELEAASVEADCTEVVGELALGAPGGVPVPPSEPTLGPETTRFIGFGLIRAAMGLSLNVLTSRRKY